MSSVTRITFMVLGVVVGAIVVFYVYIGRVSIVERKAEVRIGGQTVIVDVAKTEKDRARGLSGRTKIGINEGMLFLFPNEGRYPFWMKDMRVPIDILWIREGRIVGVEEMVYPEQNISPEMLTLYTSPLPVDKVLELAGGRFHILRARIGNVVRIRPLVGGSALP